MTREDLKDYKYNQRWIEDRANYIKNYRETINQITSTLSNTPKRK